MNSHETSEKYLIFTVGKNDYSLPVSEVEGVISVPLGTINTIPFDEKGKICGIFNYKGSIVGILQTPLFAADSDLNEGNVTVVVVGHGKKQFAVIIDKAKEIAASSSDGLIINAESLYGGYNNHDN